jgi:phage terminase large subunit
VLTYLPTGQKILFRGFDDPHKLTSITVPIGVLCWVWVEEAFEIDDEEEFKTLDESIRGEMPDGLWKQLTLTFNPWVDSHWTKTRFFDNDDPDAFTLTTTYKCNEWLDDGDRKLIEDQEESNPERFKVVGLGEYGLPGGTFFEEFRRDIHVCEPFEIPKHWRRFRAIDYGFDMLAVAWFAVDQEKRLWLYRELYESGLTLKEAAARIQQMTPEGEKIDYTVASPDLWNRNKDTGVPEVETLKKAGLMNLRKADDRRVPGWRQVREYLKPYQVGEYKRADLVIWDCCKNAIRTLAAICKDKVNPEDCADEPHEITHMPEAIRYGVMSRPPKAVAPKKKPGLFSPAWMDAQIQEHARW